MNIDEHTPEELTGRVKEAAGDLAGDAKLKHAGQADQADAHAKRVVEVVADAVVDLMEGVVGPPRSKKE